MKIVLPTNVKYIIEILEINGYEAFVVGGSVRDLILNLTPKDWDITTSATPDIIKDIFSNYKLITTGEKHGTIGVVIDSIVYEVTTYRIDGDYLDSRHPDDVEFTDDIVKDLSRRDFTINAIAYNEKSGFIDPFEGVYDINRKAVRCVGDCNKRFKEDALRILRGLRFASVYNFDIEVKTAKAIIENKNLLSNISVERIDVEFNKILCGVNVKYILKRYREVFAVFIPEIVSTFNCTQNTPHHNKTVWVHTVTAVANVRDNLLLRMVMFMHDIGKPMAKKTDKSGVDHFYNHNKYSAEFAKNILNRLHYPSAFIENVVSLVLYHDERGLKDIKTMKKFLSKNGSNNFSCLLEVQIADVQAQSQYKREEKLQNIDNYRKMYEKIISENQCFTLKQLKINGSDLIHLGITKGKYIGEILNRLLSDVIEEKIPNENKILKEQALKIYAELN